jgi:hypothetical protein
VFSPVIIRICIKFEVQNAMRFLRMSIRAAIDRVLFVSDFVINSVFNDAIII